MKKLFINFVLRTFTTSSLILLVSCTPHENPQKSSHKGKGQTSASYGNMCAAAIRDLPAFSCQTGALIPITINGGQTPNSYYPDMDCDRPSLLPLGKNSDGQCIPYSRVLNLSVGDAQVAALCRQKKIRTESSVLYDEIDIVAHNAKDGSTCWFQAAGKNGQPIDGTLVPSPMKIAKAKDYKKVKAIWNTPAQTAKDDCGGCHDNDPFMYSPFIGQVWEHVPTDPEGWYKHLGQDFKDWKPVSLSTRNNPCVGCHRLGVQFTSGQGTEEATGLAEIANADEWAQTYPASHFMPVGNFHSQAQWNVIYAKAVDDILECHKAYGNNDKSKLGILGCLTEPITGKP
ncbi:hypothetical protein [Kiloniella antarctica]|uniref:Cytochrome c domain-containing protein n=1 Tax=Kiloniella antarctica TaxID=1550907 RepID=A0ABW5BLT5_9PROT